MVAEKLDAPAILRRIPLFAAVTEQHIEALAAATRERRLAKGETLFQRGDSPRGFYAVVFGQVKLAFSSPQGTEKVVEIIGPQQTFGEAVMFLDRPYPVFCQSLADTLLLFIPRSTVFDLLDTDHAFARHMVAGLAMRLHHLVQDVESYSLRSSTQRLIGYLLQQCPDEADASSGVDIDLPTSKQVIASRLNLTPETFSRILHELTQTGLISVSGRHITIHDPRRLRSFEP